MNDAPLTASRLTLARKRKGLTLAKLAELSGVSSRSLSDYENGRKQPSQQTTQALAMALDVRVDFLTAADLEEIPAGRVSFRALTKMTASQRDAALSAARIAILINDWIEQRFTLPMHDLPTLTGRPPEDAAHDLRGIWGLGEAPISNIIHLLESHGVRVFSLPHQCHEIDAFAFFWQKQPFVLLNTTKSGERGRFDASHELGHLVLHSEYENPRGREPEHEADRFASALLMPAEDIRAHRLNNAGVDRILSAKKRWGVSAVALNYRLKEIGMVTEWGHRANARNLSRMGYRRSEPGGINRESSQLLSKVFRYSGPGRVSVADLAADLALTTEELNHYLFGLVTTAIPGGGQTTARKESRLKLVQY